MVSGISGCCFFPKVLKRFTCGFVSEFPEDGRVRSKHMWVALNKCCFCIYFAIIKQTFSAAFFINP